MQQVLNKTVLLSLMIPVTIIALCAGLIFFFAEVVGEDNFATPTPETPTGDPAEAARTFMEALYNGNISQCTDLSTAEIRLWVQDQCLLYQQYSQFVDMRDAEFELLNRQTVDRATIRMSGNWVYKGIDYQTGEPIEQVVNTPLLLGMKYEDGRWRVDGMEAEIEEVEQPYNEALTAFLESAHQGEADICLSFLLPGQIEQQEMQQSLENFCTRFVGRNGSIDLQRAEFEVLNDNPVDMTLDTRLIGEWSIRYTTESGETVDQAFNPATDGAPVFSMRYLVDRWYIIAMGIDNSTISQE